MTKVHLSVAHELKTKAASYLVLTALFVMLINGVAGETNDAARRCHWCGPLAEQIHRSRRALPCDATTLDSQTTTCEPGYQYCAVVATTPHRTESRFCVKLYQDECYTLYCNTTKTWKMTCPCRGDLCNGPVTQREIDAFTVLGKLSSNSLSSSLKRTKRKANSELEPPEDKPDANDNPNAIDDNNHDQVTTMASSLPPDNPTILPSTVQAVVAVTVASTIEDKTAATTTMQPSNTDKLVHPEKDAHKNNSPRLYLNIYVIISMFISVNL